MSEKPMNPQTIPGRPEEAEADMTVAAQPQGDTQAHTSDNFGQATDPGLQPAPQPQSAFPRTQEELLEAKNEAMELKTTAADFFRAQRFQEVSS